MGSRDDFSERTKRILGERVGLDCSNPDCRVFTKGPHTGKPDSVNIGVAAHIHAASPGGKRYDPSQTPEERRGVDNGIWLCQSCAKLIDGDAAKYSPELLRRWRRGAEHRAEERVGKRTDAHAPPQVVVHLVAMAVPGRGGKMLPKGQILDALPFLRGAGLILSAERYLRSYSAEEIDQAPRNDAEEMRKFNQQASAWLAVDDHRKQLETFLLEKEFVHMPTVGFRLDCSGTQPALDVRCKLDFPAGFRLFRAPAMKAERPQDAPMHPVATDKMPVLMAAEARIRRRMREAPQRPQSLRWPDLEVPPPNRAHFHAMLFAARDSNRDMLEGALATATVRIVSETRIEICSDKLLQNEPVPLDSDRCGVVVVPPPEVAIGSAIRATVNSDSHPSPAEATIPIEIL